MSECAPERPAFRPIIVKVEKLNEVCVQTQVQFVFEYLLSLFDGMAGHDRGELVDVLTVLSHHLSNSDLLLRNS